MRDGVYLTAGLVVILLGCFGVIGPAAIMVGGGIVGLPWILAAPPAKRADPERIAALEIELGLVSTISDGTQVYAVDE